MKDRIRQIMESKHMTQQVFADFLGINAATLSGIFNDRTKPTLNIVEAVRKKFPDISLDWLMFGQGEMNLQQIVSAQSAVNDQPAPAPSVSSVQQPMLDFSIPPTTSSYGHTSSPTPQQGLQQVSPANSVRNTRQELLQNEVRIIDKPKRHITEIRVYYDDQTWESFVPSKK
ncbi:MAG: helix-turn-helix transcriptional regulator [Prevotella sp.]|nr:helix-turn-helix transcriptional regulator [Prevotella sp.]